MSIMVRDDPKSYSFSMSSNIRKFGENWQEFQEQKSSPQSRDGSETGLFGSAQAQSDKTRTELKLKNIFQEATPKYWLSTAQLGHSYYFSYFCVRNVKKK